MRKLACLLLLTPLAWGTTFYRQKIAVDLNGDGRKEWVVLKPYTVGEVTKGQLMVLDSGGKIMWTGPRIKDAYSNSPWAFLGEFDLGDIAWIDDYDGDGQVDLCATYQKSDVRPTQFRLFHWNGKGFVYDKSAMLVPAPQKPATLIWRAYSPDASTWAETMTCTSPGNYKVDMASPPESPPSWKVRYQSGEGFVLTN
ncbi:hypothetical protein JST97_35210 [bacterium]|nr:hypothetical protein [bacterium]